MKTVFIALLILLSGLTVFAAYMGAFMSVHIHEKSIGPFHLVYKEMVGTDFKKVGQITTDLDSMLKRVGLSGYYPLDIYFPDTQPNQIGFMVQDSSVSGVLASDSTIRYRLIPLQLSMVTEFPYRNPMSFFLGYMKIDKSLSEHRHHKKYKKTEAGTINYGDTIVYFQPIIPISESDLEATK